MFTFDDVVHYILFFVFFFFISATTLCRFYRRQCVSCGGETLASYAGQTASATLSKEIWNVARLGSSTDL